MAGSISEFFGYRAEDRSKIARKAASDKKCPFLGSTCVKLFGRTREISGVCAIRQKKAGSPSVVCCPNRIYADNYAVLYKISRMAFGCDLPLCAGRAAVEKSKSAGGAVAVFGHALLLLFYSFKNIFYYQNYSFSSLPWTILSMV